MELTIALNRYDRHVPIFDGSVKPPQGVTLRPLEVGESHELAHGGSPPRAHAQAPRVRHRRDVARVLGRRGGAIRPTCRWSAFRFFRAASSASGRSTCPPTPPPRSPPTWSAARSGCTRSRPRLSVLAKGDFKREYGIAWQDIHWICLRPEIVEVDLGKDVTHRVAAAGQGHRRHADGGRDRRADVARAAQVDAGASGRLPPAVPRQPGGGAALFPQVRLLSGHASDGGEARAGRAPSGLGARDHGDVRGRQAHRLRILRRFRLFPDRLVAQCLRGATTHSRQWIRG